MKKNYLVIFIAVLMILICCIFAVNIFKTNKKLTLGHLPPLEIADIIMREGVGMDSAVIKKISESNYTHIGLIISLNPLLILHATTNDNKNVKNQVIISTLDEFAKNAKNIAIKRYNLSEIKRENIKKDSKKYIGQKFILESKDNLKDSSNTKEVLYCTTLIESILTPYANLNISYTFIDMPLFRGYYLLPKEFLKDSNSTFIFRTD